jgi:hypothetical protein
MLIHEMIANLPLVMRHMDLVDEAGETRLSACRMSPATAFPMSQMMVTISAAF